MLFPVILKIYGTANKLIILKSCLNFGDKYQAKGALTEMKESFIGKNKDSRSDDVCLVPLLYFRHQLNVK